MNQVRGCGCVGPDDPPDFRKVLMTTPHAAVTGMQDEARPDSGQVVVALHSVSFGYPPAGLAEPVLQNIDLEVRDRDFLGLIGPNGGGKTTLLRLILGLSQPQRGEVLVFGRRPHDVRRRIGYVPQHARIDNTVPATVLDLVLTGRLHRSSWGPFYRRSDVRAAIPSRRRGPRGGRRGAG